MLPKKTGKNLTQKKRRQRKNEQSFLLIAGYNTDIARTCDNRFVMPNDTAEKKLIVSVHYYTPWSYCRTASAENWGTKGNYEEQNGGFLCKCAGKI